LSYDDSDYGDDDDVDDHVDHDSLKGDVDDLELADRFDNEGAIRPGAWSAGLKRDPIKRAWNLIRFLRASDHRKLGFQKCIINGNAQGWFTERKPDGTRQPLLVPPKELLRDVKTRWDSVYYMICRLRALRPVRSSYQSASRD
jgi:hypothetical protein